MTRPAGARKRPAPSKRRRVGPTDEVEVVYEHVPGTPEEERRLRDLLGELLPPRRRHAPDDAA